MLNCGTPIFYMFLYLRARSSISSWGWVSAMSMFGSHMPRTIAIAWIDSSNGYPNLSLAIGSVFLRDSIERSFVVLLKFRLILDHLPKVVVWLRRFEHRSCSRKCKAQDVKYTSRHPPPFREVSSRLPKIHRSFITLLDFWILSNIHRPCSLYF